MNGRSPRVDAIYARYSCHRQDDSTSIEVQIESCELSAGHPLAQYIDRAKTGRTTANRDALLRLMADAEAGRIARVWVYKFDRLGRHAETHLIVSNLEECGVEVISATEGKEALARGVQLVVAEHYSRALAERTRDGLLKRFENHEWTGGRPSYGYQVLTDDVGKKRLAVHPQEAEAVRYVISTYLSEPAGFKELAHRLTSKGIPTRKRAPWCLITVRGILTSRSGSEDRLPAVPRRPAEIVLPRGCVTAPPRQSSRASRTCWARSGDQRGRGAPAIWGWREACRSRPRNDFWTMTNGT